VPGRSQQQCFAVVRSALERSAELSDLSPAAAVVLAEIQLHMGQPSLPAVSGELALPAGSFDADALLEGVFADDLEPEGLRARGFSMQELAVSVATSFALDLESEGMCARGISPPETAHVSFGHGGEEKVIPSPSANAHVVSGRCLYRGLFTTVQRSYSSIRKGSLAAKAVFVEVGKRGSLCIAWLVAISLLFYCLCCCLDLHVGNFTVSELGRPAQFFEVQGTFSGVSTRGELSVVAEGSAELQLSEGDLVPDSRGVDVVGAGPAADAGRDSRSKSTTAATKSRKRAWQAFFVSLSVRDPPYTKREQNQFFKQLEAAFLSNDRDGDGFISFSELHRAVTRLVPGRGVIFFAMADLNRDGVLGFDEYLELDFSGLDEIAWQEAGRNRLKPAGLSAGV
jgi:hypothetical protein